MLCTTKKFVKRISTQMKPKCCEDSVSQPIKWEIFNAVSIAFSSLVWCFQLTCGSTSYILSWATGKSQEAGAALNMFSALHWSYNAQKMFSIYSSWKVWCVVFWRDLPHMSLLSAFHFNTVIWNDSKQKLSHQEAMHKSRNWTEWYDWSAGLKREHQLARAQPTPETWKKHMQPVGGGGGGGGGA